MGARQRRRRSGLLHDFARSLRDGRRRANRRLHSGISSIDPNIQFFACPWSPPGWMKNGGTVREGSAKGSWLNSIKQDAFEEYGEYLASFALYFHQQNLPLLALSMGNEVHFNHDFNSMYLVGEDMLKAIRATKRSLDQARAAVPSFRAPLLTADDHVLNGYFYDSGFVPLIEGISSSPEAKSAVNVVSYHGYGVDAQTPENASTTVLGRLLDKVRSDLGEGVELWMTETSGFHNGLLAEADRVGALTMAEGLYTSLAYANVSAWTFFGPEELLHYGFLSWPGVALKHFARFIRPGAVRFGASSSEISDRLLVVAFENPATSDLGRSYAIVIINKDGVPHGLDLSDLPMLDGYDGYREYRSSVHNACQDRGTLRPSDTSATPFVIPPHGIVTLYQGRPVPTL
ncbi:MAG: glycoside hydrolase family 30 protein [Myxococcales bacterium]|nr:glycoside hydrolase family 30 protein [Myxococcales bacterium]